MNKFKVRTKKEGQDCVRTSVLDMLIPIFPCNGVSFESAIVSFSNPKNTSNKRYAQSKLHSSFAFPRDLSIEVSRFEMATADIPAMKSAFASRNKAFKGAL
jgi:hypothetical protein